MEPGTGIAEKLQYGVDGLNGLPYMPLQQRGRATRSVFVLRLLQSAQPVPGLTRTGKRDASAL